MTDPTSNALVLGGVLVLLAAGGLTRWRGQVALVLAVVACIIGYVLKILVPADVIYLPQWAGLAPESLGLVLAAAYGLLLRRLGGPSLRGPVALVAPLMGAGMGEVAAAATLGACATDGRAAGRLALAAAGGAMIGRVGDPGLLLLGARDPWAALLLAPVGLGMVVLAWPTRDLVEELPQGRLEVTVLAGIVGLLAMVPGLTLAALTVGCLGAAALHARVRTRVAVSLGPLAWAIGSVALVLIATAGGVPEFAAAAMEQAEVYWGSVPLPVVTGMAGLLGMMLDAPAAALLGTAAVDRTLDLLAPEGLALAIAAGVGAGGLGPLVAAGGLRKGLPRWIVGVLLAVVWVAVLQHLL